MQDFQFEIQQALPIDEEAKAAIEEAQADVRRGHVCTMEEARTLVREQ